MEQILLAQIQVSQVSQSSPAIFLVNSPDTKTSERYVSLYTCIVGCVTGKPCNICTIKVANHIFYCTNKTIHPDIVVHYFVLVSYSI